MTITIRLCEYGKQENSIIKPFFDILKNKTKELEKEGIVKIYSDLEAVSALKPIH